MDSIVGISFIYIIFKRVFYLYLYCKCVSNKLLVVSF